MKPGAPKQNFQGKKVKAGSHEAISCTQPLSNSLIRNLSLWFQDNSTKESYDTNRIVKIGLYEH